MNKQAKNKKERRTKQRRGMLVTRMRPFLVRVPDDLREWIEDTAASFGLSRDSFLRLQLAAMRDGFKQLSEAGSDEHKLFKQFESSLLQRTEQAVQSAVEQALKRPRLK